ncbi:hypothetical protein [Nitritalea halalkaliphila]|uniref:hypothetical protein n=1 Tax=Nitritalea halalkaliphila TaxID=590849 RepID=UPI0002DF04B3|nr:hypothetical protein [Nitritalea halalkaliphila]
MASGTLKVPKARKRALRQAIHYVGKYGLLGHLQHRGQRDVLYLERLRGYLHFWQHVEPQHPYLEKGLGTLRAEAARLTEKWDTATAGTPFPSSY